MCELDEIEPNSKVEGNVEEDDIDDGNDVNTSGTDDSLAVDTDDEDDPQSEALANSSGSDVSMTSDSESEDETAAEINEAGPSQNEAGENEEEEDEVVKAIRKARENIQELPRDISSDVHIVEISFHPQQNMIALALITGDVLLYKYCNDKEAELLNTLELHTKACRDIEFSADGSTLFSVGKDKSIMVSDIETGQLKTAFDDAHDDPIYTLYLVNENQLVTGDETGSVKLWDLRQQRSLFTLKETNEYVSDMITTNADRHLVCSCGDGSLTVLNLPARKLHMQSEMYDVDLNCLGLLRRETKLVVGTSSGNLLFFNWGEFGYHNDEYPGPKSSINHLVTPTENIVITACDDGNIRAAHLFHNRYLGIIGQHPFSVEAMDISVDGRLVASCSHEQVVKFWDISFLEGIKVDETVKEDKKKRSHNLPSSRVANRADFFAGLAD